MKTIDLVNELRGTTCRCRANKKRGQTFCKACYYALPTKLRRALYRRVGEGYEEAYAEAVNFLDWRQVE